MGDIEMTTGHDNTGGSVGNGGGSSSEDRRDNTVSEQAEDNTESSDKSRGNSTCLFVCSALVLIPGLILIVIHAALGHGMVTMIFGVILLTVGALILATACCFFCKWSNRTATDTTYMTSSARNAGVSGTGPTVIVHPTTMIHPPGGANAPVYGMHPQRYPTYPGPYTPSLHPGHTPSGVGPYLPAGVQPNFSGATAPPLEIPQYDSQPDPNHPPPPSYEQAVAVK